MPKVRVAPILDDEIGVGLEEGDDFLVGRHGLLLQDAARRLVDHLRDARQQRAELRAQAIARLGRRQRVDMRERTGGIRGARLRAGQEVAIRGTAAWGVADGAACAMSMARRFARL